MIFREELWVEIIEMKLSKQIFLGQKSSPGKFTRKVALFRRTACAGLEGEREGHDSKIGFTHLALPSLTFDETNSRCIERLISSKGVPLEFKKR